MAPQIKLPAVASIILSALFLCSPHLAAAQTTNDPPGWTRVWSDEFDGPNGSAVNSQRWTMETGGGGWGNNELQTYTNRTQNAYLEDGMLVIKAMRETFTGTDGIRREYTSARLKTQDKFTQTYGRFEARIKVPFGQGIWPAFWMLGNNIPQAGWPRCGEIDVMEIIGREPSRVYGTIHGPGYSGAGGIGGNFTLPNGEQFKDGFHLFAIEWQPREIRWFMDDKLFKTLTSKDLPAGADWVFNHPFFLLLNVAVGGNWPGNPDATTVFPQTMQVDYVRVYRPRTASVSAASYRDTALAPESIAAAFGSGLANATSVALATPLPTSLGGTTLSVKDGMGNERPAPLFFVSPGQVNFLVPPESALGSGLLSITNADGGISVGAIQLEKIAPGIFAANADGTGVPYALALRFRADGLRIYEAVSRWDGQQHIPVPIDLGAESDQVFLIAFGTGFRGLGGLGPVSATIGGVAAQVVFAGPQGDLVGLDQLNLRLPRSLAGRGLVDVSLNIAGQAANRVQIYVK